MEPTIPNKLSLLKQLIVFYLFILIPSICVAGTTGKISGNVSDKETGKPLAGVNIQIKGTYQGAASDENGYYVICDRFLDSTLAYQSFGRGIDLNLVKSITNEAVDGLIPSTTFLLDCNIDTCLSRIDKKDRMESEGKEFLIKVKNGFLELAKLNRNRYVIVDANKSINKISNYIWEQFLKRYKDTNDK